MLLSNKVYFNSVKYLKLQFFAYLGFRKNILKSKNVNFSNIQGNNLISLWNKHDSFCLFKFNIFFIKFQKSFWNKILIMLN